jgi:hypothetical protein
MKNLFLATLLAFAFIGHSGVAKADEEGGESCSESYELTNDRKGCLAYLVTTYCTIVGPAGSETTISRSHYDTIGECVSLEE